MKRDLFMISLRGVAIENDKILLVMETEERRWETPGGGIMVDEKIEDALKREFLEETGYDIEILKPLTTYNRHGFVFINFLVKLKDKIKEPLNDIAGIKWFTKEEIKKILKNNEVDDHDVEAFKMFINGELE